MRRALAVFILALGCLGGLTFAQDQIPIQLRLTSAMTGKVDYYISPPGGSPRYLGSIQPGATTEIESRQGQVYLFAQNRVRFQEYTVRGEKFQHLTIAPKEQQRPPQVVNTYQGTPDTMQPAEQMGEAPPVQPQQSAGPPDTNGLAWQYSRFANEADQGAVNAQLVLGIPETDAVQFFAVCSARSRGVPVVQVSADVSQFQDGSPIKVRFAGQGFERSVDGKVVRPAGGEAIQGVRLAIPANDPLWLALPRLANAIYSVGGQQAVAMSLGGIAGPLGSFLQDCRSLAGGGSQVADASSMPATSLFQDNDAGGGPSATTSSGGNAGGDQSCVRLRNARAKPGGQPVRVTFVNKTNEYRVLMMIDDEGMPIEFAQLEGGKSFKIDTTTTEPWMMTDGPGNCIEMMMPSANRAMFAMTRVSPGFGPDGD